MGISKYKKFAKQTPAEILGNMPKMLVIGLAFLSLTAGYLLRGVKDDFFSASPGLCQDSNIPLKPAKAKSRNQVEPFKLEAIYLLGTRRGKQIDVKPNGTVVIELEEQEDEGPAPFGYPTFNIYPSEYPTQKSLDITQPQEYEQNFRYRNLGLF